MTFTVRQGYWDLPPPRVSLVELRSRRQRRAARIDYAFASPALACPSIAFTAPTTAGRHHLVGPRECSPLADHTPVVADLEPQLELAPVN